MSCFCSQDVIGGAEVADLVGRLAGPPPRRARHTPLGASACTLRGPLVHFRTDPLTLNHILSRFSITKWIHLNHLNPGLLAFFHRLHRSLRPGGRLILEPQPFASYKDSARLSDQLRANYEVLRDGDGDGVKGWREEEGEFERVLLGEVGFERRERLGETGEKGKWRAGADQTRSGGSGTEPVLSVCDC